MALFHMLVSSAGVLVSPLWLVPQIYFFALCTLPLRTLRTALSLVGLRLRPQLLAEFAIVLYQYVAVAFVLGAAAGAANWVLFWLVSGAFTWIDQQLRFDTGSIVSWVVGLGPTLPPQQPAAAPGPARTKHKYEKHPCRASPAATAPPATPDTTTDTTAATPATPPASEPVVPVSVPVVPDPAPAAEPAAPAAAAAAAAAAATSSTPPALPDRPTLPQRDETVLSSVRHTVTSQTRPHSEDAGTRRSRASARPPSYDADTTATTATGVSHSTVSATTNSSFEDDHPDSPSYKHNDGPDRA